MERENIWRELQKQTSVINLKPGYCSLGKLQRMGSGRD
jgi:hypothetical protein